MLRERVDVLARSLRLAEDGSSKEQGKGNRAEAATNQQEGEKEQGKEAQAAEADAEAEKEKEKEKDQEQKTQETEKDGEHQTGEKEKEKEKQQREDKKKQQNKKQEEKKKEKNPFMDMMGNSEDWEPNMKDMAKNMQEQKEALYFIGGAFLVFFVASMIDEYYGEKEITWKEFSADILESGVVHHLVVKGDRCVQVFTEARQTHPPFYFSIGDKASFEKKLIEAQNDLGKSVSEYVPVTFLPDNSDDYTMSSLLSRLLLLQAGLLLFRGATKGLGGFLPMMTKNKAREILPENIKVRFPDVAGCDEAKLEIQEFVDFLKTPQKFKELGARIPKGALLVGPPGTGKTLLAKATAGEAGVPFFSISGSEFIEIFGGVGPARVRSLFRDAQAKAPSIIFIDEIDAIGGKRDHRQIRSGGSDERENTLNQLLVEMDGFKPGKDVVVLAATNREDVLDKALLRPGRFDRKVVVGLPEISGRKDILLVHMKNLKLGGDMLEWAKKIATLTPGMSGADLANICNEGALIAARHHSPTIELPHLEQAIERVIAGLEKKTRVLSTAEKKTVAYHEAGHAVIGWFLEHADPLLKVSIVPRGDALGYAQLQLQERNLYLQEQILDKVCMALGGRAAEDLVFGEITNGASDDLSRVTQMVYGCVTKYGFDSEIGHLSFPEMDNFQVEKPYSDHTSRLIDLQVRSYVQNAYQRTLNLLIEKREELEKVAQLLLQREILSRADMEELIGKRPWNQSTSYEEMSGEVEEQHQ